jgi:F420-non-reducing hydrogenase large subunit
VATQNNAARIAMSVEKAAKGLISKGEVSGGILNKVEMAFRAYDPCHACATHSLPGSMPLLLQVRGPEGEIVSTLQRDADGSLHRH